MNNTNPVTVRHSTRTIEVTKTFERKASRYGSEEYNTLKAVRNDNPDYKVVVKASAKRSDPYAGLTFDFMRGYIATHDDAEGTNMETFLGLIGDSEEAREMGFGAACYGEVRAWFLRTYPAFEAFAAKRKMALSIYKNNGTDKVAA